MPNTTVSTGAAAPRMGLFARVVGVITSPRATFESVVAHPAWLGMMVFAIVVFCGLVGGFMFTTVGQNAWLEAVTANATDQQYEMMLRMSKWLGYMSVVQFAVLIPIVTVIVAGILYGIFNTMGGDATFKQVMAVTIHAMSPLLLAQLFTVPMNYARGKLASATSLAVALPMVDDKSFLGRLLGAVDLFLIWWVLVLAIGLGVLYRRRTQPIATALLAVYAVIAIVVALIGSRLGGA
jgi:hypothetical protein